MPVPGLAATPAPVLTARITSSSSTTTDLYALLGSPSGAIRYHLFVDSGVVLGSSTTGQPALDASGFDTGAIGVWFVDGDIIGCGGAGGEGDGYFGGIPADFGGGGGGGGAGSQAGAGGVGFPNGADGSDGGTWPTSTGGAAGANSDNATNGIYGGAAPTNGGDAVTLNHSVEITLAGTIGGGGGGGDGGYYSVVPQNAGDGGDVGFDGAGLSPGSAGYAIRYSGSGSASITGGTVLGLTDF